jgi:hypothetical protein
MWYLAGPPQRPLCYESHSQTGARSLASQGQAAHLPGIGCTVIADLGTRAWRVYDILDIGPKGRYNGSCTGGVGRVTPEARALAG